MTRPLIDSSAGDSATGIKTVPMYLMNSQQAYALHFVVFGYQVPLCIDRMVFGIDTLDDI